MLRAWRSQDKFEGRSSLRTWLYKIATNACFDALDKRSRRGLPQTSYPMTDGNSLPDFPVTDPVWLQPYPDEWLNDVQSNPEARYSTLESVSLAFLVALQTLPARQRAVLILRDVLDWRASEVAELIETTVSSVNSVLHRARVTLSKSYEGGPKHTVASEPLDAVSKDLLDNYVSAWERADVAGLVSLLREDAIFAMPPTPSWYQGHDAITKVLASVAFADPATEWQFVQIRSNGQPAVVFYRRDEPTGPFTAVGIQVLTIDGPAITEVTTFLEPQWVPKFGLPAEMN
jgi:RNA polymerase sigma-70 factor (ECF subfamily)